MSVCTALFFLLPYFVEGRLGEPTGNASTKSSEESAGQGDSLLSGLVNSTALNFAASEMGGYEYFTTTTVYGDSQFGACGGIKTADLVQGTPYYNVASAQAMWLNCKSHGNCMCGKSGGGSGTAPMGCFTCARGRFLRSAYGYKGGRLLGEMDSAFASEEIIVVVGDLCPYDGNERWCPEKAGEKNSYGSLNHLDFSHPPEGIVNNNFVFTPTACPDDLRHRYLQMAGHCGEA
eukprot:TRINITY_DN2879_c0_g1_i1.p1 TRINITY_DN2879_c0_g1~~TRINITY_DN2879_c0_g1_i1.p1  ORF type:complete len:250 (+),score=57.69 TRINITY_DN2879_c0_g1_i1:53-751(+)